MNPIPAFIVRGDDGVEYGPVDLAELREWVVENRVGLGTSVRADATEGDWNPWQHYPELVALLAEVRATGGPVQLPVLAPFGRRVAAFFGDFVLSLLVLAPLIVLLYAVLPEDVFEQMLFYAQSFGQGGLEPAAPIWWQILYNLTWLAVPMAYYAYFHRANGSTRAKEMLRLRVVDAEGRTPAFNKLLLRSFIFTVCVYYFLGIPLFYAFLNPQRRALHDIAAGTYVVES